MLLHLKSPLSHQDCKNARVCSFSQPTISKSEDAAIVWVLQGREESQRLPQTRHIAAVWLTQTGLCH